MSARLPGRLRSPAGGRVHLSPEKRLLTGLAMVAAFFMCIGPTMAAGNDTPGWELLEVRQIWDRADHNAFTDLVHYEGYWYCAFREAGDHHSDDGRLRVIRSPDGRDWKTVALMQGENPGDDVRDGKLTVTADGYLMLSGAITLKGDPNRNRESVTWLSPDGEHWSRPHVDETADNTWRWSVAWHDGAGYSIGYTGKDRHGTLYRTHDGINWEVVAEDIYPRSEDGFANEADLHFMEDGALYVLLRRDSRHRDWSADAADTSALLGISAPPYTEWEWKDLGVRVGGPVLYRLEDGRFVTVARLYSPPRTALLEVDTEAPSMRELLDLPSGGDTGYAGIVQHGDELWFSYYSSHEGKTSIYLAKVRIPDPRERKSR